MSTTRESGASFLTLRVKETSPVLVLSPTHTNFTSLGLSGSTSAWWRKQIVSALCVADVCSWVPGTRKQKIREREMFYLTTHTTHFIYGYMASDIWLRTILIVRKETRCRHIGYSHRLTARVLLYAPSHRQDNTYQGRKECFIPATDSHWPRQRLCPWAGVFETW